MFCSVHVSSEDSTTALLAASPAWEDELDDVDFRLTATLPAAFVFGGWERPSLRHFSEQKFGSTNSSAIP